MKWYTDGLGQRLTIWYAAQPFTESYALRPYSLKEMLRGCKAFSSSGPEALRVQQNLTGFPAPYREAATALGNWVPADGGSADHGHQDEVVLLNGPLGCSGSWHSTAADQAGE